MWLTHVEPLPLLASSANFARGIRVTDAAGLVGTALCVGKGNFCSARCLASDVSRAADAALAIAKHDANAAPG